MTKNYLTYPFKVMRITQNYSGKTSHYPHTQGNIKDYPIDEGGKDTGRDAFYCPCDKMIVKRVYGVGNGGVNTLWLESSDIVYFADGTSGIVTMLLTHPNDSDLKGIKAGKVYKRGEVICHEGTDGATGNHIHLSAGKGKFSGNGWTKNSKGKYVLTCTGGGKKPETLFYVDKSFTTIKSNGGLAFKTLPLTSSAGYYKVNTAVLNVRKAAGTAYAKNGTLKMGNKVKIIETKNNWGKIGTNKWICLDYCVKVGG